MSEVCSKHALDLIYYLFIAVCLFNLFIFHAQDCFNIIELQQSWKREQAQRGGGGEASLWDRKAKPRMRTNYKTLDLK